MFLIRQAHEPKQKRARANWACPGEFAEDYGLAAEVARFEALLLALRQRFGALAPTACH